MGDLKRRHKYFQMCGRVCVHCSVEMATLEEIKKEVEALQLSFFWRERESERTSDVEIAISKTIYIYSLIYLAGVEFVNACYQPFTLMRNAVIS